MLTPERVVVVGRDISVGSRPIANSVSALLVAFTADQANVSTIPEPLTLSLFSVGVAGAAALRRRKKKAA